MDYIICAVIGYFVGTINPSFFLAKLNGVDIKKKGSGNAGASNVIILFGKLAGLICAVLDILKAYLAIRLTQMLFPDLREALAVTGVCCIIGHIFPFYMHFKGGKGLACLGGMILAFNWRVFLIMLFGAVVIALITDYLCFVPVTASSVFPVVYGVMRRSYRGTFILFIAAIVIFLRHLENFRRMRTGTEMHFSYLWKPEAEIARIAGNVPESEDAVNEHFLR